MENKSKEELKTALLMILIDHVGRSKAIGMGELYERVFGVPYNNRINDTRKLRTLITELRKDGSAICSTAAIDGSGYWLSSAGSELDDYCGKLRKQALKKLRMEANIRKISMPELMGQVQLDLKMGD